MDAGATGEHFFLSGRRRSDGTAVLTAAFLWIMAAPVADAAVPVAAPEPLVAVGAQSPAPR